MSGKEHRLDKIDDLLSKGETTNAHDIDVNPLLFEQGKGFSHGRAGRTVVNRAIAGCLRGRLQPHRFF